MVQMTMVEHLRELRKRLVYSLIAIGIAFGFVYRFAKPLVTFLMTPLLAAMPDGQAKRLVYTGLSQPFMVELQVAVFGAIVLALPVVLYQIWAFISPALHAHERRYVVPVIASAMACFAVGTAFCYYVAFPIAFHYFLGFTTADLQPMISINEYLDFVTKMLLGFGFMFELPLTVLFLARLGVVSPQFLNKHRRWAIVIISILAAIFSPPDALSMAVLGVPLYLLFELAVLASYLVYKKRTPLVDNEGNLT